MDDTSENSWNLSSCPAVGLVLGVATGENGILHEESAINQEKKGNAPAKKLGLMSLMRYLTGQNGIDMKNGTARSHKTTC